MRKRGRGVSTLVGASLGRTARDRRERREHRERRAQWRAEFVPFWTARGAKGSTRKEIIPQQSSKVFVIGLRQCP